jgi:hypothetical protein
VDVLRFTSLVAVAACMVVVAALVLAANPRRNWNQWLGFFAALVAGNFVAQALAYAPFIAVQDGAMAAADGARATALWGSVGKAFFILDPAVLAYFASIFPRRTALAERPWGVLLLAAPVLVFLIAEAAWRAMSQPSDLLLQAAFQLYVGGCYLYAAVRLFLNLTQEPSSIMAAQVRTVTFGVLIAIVPRVALLVTDLIRDVPGLAASNTLQYLLGTAGRAAVLGAAFLGFRHLALRAPSARRAEARAVVRWLGLACAAFVAVWVAERTVGFLGVSGVLDPAVVRWADLIDGFTIDGRWVLFTLALGAGILRYEVLAVRAPARALGELGLPVLLVFAAAAIGAAALGPWGAAAFAAVSVGVALLALHRARPRASIGAFLHERALEVYRAVLASALAEGPLDSPSRRRLATVRGQLGVSEREHDALFAIAQAEEVRGAAGEVHLGRYEVLRHLGSGTFGRVDLARDLRDGQLVVVKRLRPDEPEALSSARREVEVARRATHPNLVAIHELLEGPEPAVVMEFVEGGSLRDLLERRGRLPPAEAQDLLAQMLAGLDALHEAGIVHGDLKPENILLTARGQVKLADFGAARAAPEGRTLVRSTFAGPARGTLRYMAPEQALGERTGPSADLYAAAAIGFEMVAGRPFVEGEGGPYQMVRQIVEGASALPATLPPRWARVLERGLARHPSDRFGTASEMRAAVLGLHVADAPREPARNRRTS